MRYFLIPSPEILYKIFLCAIIIPIRQLINNLNIFKQLQADNFARILIETETF